jgi:hypothetical protein
MLFELSPCSHEASQARLEQNRKSIKHQILAEEHQASEFSSKSIKHQILAEGHQSCADVPPPTPPAPI